GLGIALMGMTTGDGKLIRRGSRMALAGVALCAVFGIFFEGVLKVGNLDLGPVATFALPVLLIAVGLAFLVRSVISKPAA
ncbi:MAG TPA: hypothetical protein VET26_07930, partial [Candidatus Sulfotelmatobacter sp.]|nr:hypothetical protein [Candidatus Sulfotelmatobacter sp.]